MAKSPAHFENPVYLRTISGEDNKFPLYFAPRKLLILIDPLMDEIKGQTESYKKYHQYRSNRKK
jgi:hypothetical protein